MNRATKRRAQREADNPNRRLRALADAYIQHVTSSAFRWFWAQVAIVALLRFGWAREDFDFGDAEQWFADMDNKDVP